jgi:hypothetical protein
LGIVRALYRAELAADMPLAETRCQQLPEIGKQYRRALDLAASVGTMGSPAAWAWTEKATGGLGAFVANSAELGLMVSATAAPQSTPSASPPQRA